MLYKYCEKLSSQREAENEAPGLPYLCDVTIISHFITLNLSSDAAQLMLQLHKEVGERKYKTTFRSFVCI